MIMVFFIVRQSIALDTLPKGQKYNQEHFLEKLPVASARIIASTSMYHIPQLRIFCHENLDCENSPEDACRISYPALRKRFVSTLQSSYLRCWINIPIYSSKELQPVTSQGSVTLLNAIRCLHAGVTK
jgi:hypothetical protein